ncbi:histone-lysine N-methyltransferase SETMAR [Plakobranchus ocellatus]|uniref:Histone-lysine N-methyltransferase SETMAR n=1 Tax=Plakobranchus ocellatus TaxID=259542 RepID=A0AAV4AVT5_9GAST|nr:histone-lysine N-methyltransferase SETMAR [Plakobranchus ocellatus]
MSKRITSFASRYCSTLDRLKEAIRRKRPMLLRSGVVRQHDNATPHSANLTQQWLQRYAFSPLPYINCYCTLPIVVWKCMQIVIASKQNFL